MDPAALLQALSACVSPDPSLRKAAENVLNQVRRARRGRCRRHPAAAAAAVRGDGRAGRACCGGAAAPPALHVCLPAVTAPQHKHAPGQVVNLLRVALEEGVDPAARQVAAIGFKNLVKRDWASEGGLLL